MNYQIQFVVMEGSVQVEQNKGCPLFNFCNCKTAICKILEPDDTCFWYRYFKKLIEKNKGQII